MSERAVGEAKALRRNLRPSRALARYHSGVYLLTHGRLLLRISRGELSSRYAGSLLGIGWVAVAPLLLLAVYAAVYLLIFRVRVPGLSGLGYVLYIFSGLVPYLMLAESLSFGVTSVLANKSVLNNTVFPIELAPPKAVLLSQPTMAVGMLVTILGVIYSRNAHWTLVLLPVVWGLQFLAMLGLAWMISLLNVVFRDLQNLISSILMLVLIISPIAYTPEMVPASLKPLLALNPFAYFVLAYQRIMVLGQGLDLHLFTVLAAFSIGLFLLGGWFFARTKAVVVDYV